MADNFESATASLTSQGVQHILLAASGADLALRPKAIYCQSAGTITLEDESQVALPYTLAAGQVLPFRPLKVTAISGGTFYGWVR